MRCLMVLLWFFLLLLTASSWIELFQWSMLFVMMMTEEMGTALIEEVVMSPPIDEAMVRVVPQVLIVGIGVVLIMDTDQSLILDPS